ncbi:uncharacterized protein MONBRDRAFT_19712 [Monosiga brevicollis MX1]|uniref:Coiled-coil domain-containing protein 93 n=1 Tax=Monosiga brevicollis TaxID=81824 RepID=A9UR30_MONBE|nr:uncharacterized protein MONBRDRAFT_19712 [Monosiga brevicollis MX1]EDQ91848.1 predicted protein [Monosiga brevicollis MX1]|eukprot:XP_001743134.1 hypothetical protein [Monosiga brevicollis MX1]
MAASAGSVFANVKKGIKAKAYDAEGQEVAFDVRDDEEQSVKLSETVDLLLAAGYFRARIKGLSAFDKVVGGMTWCITASNVDVDVDLLFQENSTIGQKIALTEKIVAALPIMKCPHRLEPHQIQGLDFIHIYPVIQWLVKKAIETREERALQIRRRALFVFGQHEESPEEAKRQERLPATQRSSHDTKEHYAPKRRYRAPALGSAPDEATAVETTLLEYGQRYGIRRKQAKAKSAKEAAVAASLGADDTDDAAAEEEARRLDQLMQTMGEAGEDKVSKARLGSIIEQSTNVISKLSDEYRAHAAEVAKADEGRQGGVAAHKRAVQSLNKRIDAAQSDLDALQAQRDETHRRYESAKARLAEAQTEHAQLEEEARQLDGLEGDESNKPIIEKLRTLLATMDDLKARQGAFKATCQAEMERLQGEIEGLRATGAIQVDDERAQAVQQQLQEEQARLDKAKISASKRNRQVAYLERQLDQIPSRSELKQYQRRFVELYEQINAKHRETQHYFALYNTLSDTKSYMMNENSLLQSIQETFPKAVLSTNNKRAFLDQLAKIVDGIDNNKERLREKEGSARERRDQLSQVHLALIETERRYFKAVRDYEQDMKRNAKLAAQLAAKTGSA